MRKRLLREIRKLCTTINPGIANRIMYFALMKKRLILTPPRTFSEKINYLKLHVFQKDPLVIRCTDKVAVADYVREKTGESVLVERYGVWEHPEEIPWGSLPQQFVLTCNHGCGYNIICADKSKLDKEETIRQLKRWLKEDFWKTTCEPHYRHIPPRILCERYLGEELCDYKFFCFHGEPLYFYISKTKKGDFHSGEFAMFQPNGDYAPFQRSDHRMFREKPPMPEQLDQMLEIARQLAADFPFVRVDLFFVDGKIFFSELTFTPCSGMMPLTPQEADAWLGDLLDLNSYSTWKE